MEIQDLPVYGVGHSMGCLQHLLISARYASTSRAGNILMSFNNKPATDAIPFFSPFIAPGARALGPFLAQVCQQLAPHPVPNLSIKVLQMPALFLRPVQTCLLQVGQATQVHSKPVMLSHHCKKACCDQSKYYTC